MNTLGIQDAVPSESSYRFIPLTQGQFAIVDEADFEWLNQWPWSAVWSPTSKGFYAVRHISNEAGKRINLQMHNLILNTPKNRRGDHISGNTLDNRRVNLRIATKRGNAINRRMRSDNTSGYVGVLLEKRWSGTRWSAFISVDGKKRSLGSFATREEAIHARQSAERRYYGEYVRNHSLAIPVPIPEELPLRAKSARNTSGFTGVARTYSKRRGTKVWRAYGRIDGKPKHLGYFYTPEEAAIRVQEFESLSQVH